MGTVAAKNTDEKIKEFKQNKLKQCELYIKAGFGLIPLEPQGKKPFPPLLPKNSEGKGVWKPLKQRKATLPEVKNWLEKYPEINIGIITGKVSGLVVLDIDHNIDSEGNKIIKFANEIESPTAITSQGKHIYFKTNKEIKSKKMRNPKTGEGIADLQAEGSYVVAPPSIHNSGTQYKWEEKNSIIQTNLFNYKDINLVTTRNNILLLVVTNFEGLQRDSLKTSNKASKLPKFPDTSFKDNARRSKYDKKLDTNQWWIKLQKDFEVAKEIMNLADVKVEKLGKAFECPFHKDDNPSASLYMIDDEELQEGKNNFIAYADFHKKGRSEWFDPEKDKNKYRQQNGSKQQWFNLSEVFFAIETGNELQKLPAGVGVIWWFRALDKIGYCKSLPAIPAKKLPKPDKKGNYFYSKKEEITKTKLNGEKYTVEKKREYVISENSVKKVYEGFKYLLKLKTLYDEKQVGTAFSHRFAADWCDVSSKTAGKALTYLMQKGFIYVREEKTGNKANILDLNRKSL